MYMQHRARPKVPRCPAGYGPVDLTTAQNPGSQSVARSSNQLSPGAGDRERRMEAANRSSILVLIVEDDAATRENLREILETVGHRSVLAGDGAEAIEALRRLQADGGELPGVILLDLVMPVNAWEFRYHQEQDPVLREIPVIVMSGIYEAAPAFECLHAADYLDKPIKIPRLIAMIERHAR